MIKKRVTIKDVAEKAGVNPSTVSRVINDSDKYKISEVVKNKIRRIMDELEYEPQIYAQSIKTGRSGNLAIVLHSLENDFSSPTSSLVWASFCREAMKLGYNTLIIPLEGENFDLDITRKIRAGVADGYLLGGVLIGSLTKKEIASKKHPTVCYVSDQTDLVDELNGIKAIYANNTPVFNELLKLLSGSGVVELALFGPNIKRLHRIKQFDYQAKKMGMKTRCFSYSVSNSFVTEWRNAFNAALGLLDELKKYKAVFCNSDLEAMGLCDALRTEGIIPGKDIFVIGCDNIEKRYPNINTKPYLTTIDKNESDIGKEMAKELDRRIKGGKIKNGSVGIPSKLIIRDSFNPTRRNLK